jgi:hypothetical protein
MVILQFLAYMREVALILKYERDVHEGRLFFNRLNLYEDTKDKCGKVAGF